MKPEIRESHGEDIAITATLCRQMYWIASILLLHGVERKWKNENNAWNRYENGGV